MCQGHPTPMLKTELHSNYRKYVRILSNDSYSACVQQCSWRLAIVRAVTTGYAKVHGALGPPCLDATEAPYFTYLPIGKWLFGIKLFLCSNHIRTQTITRVPVVISSSHCKNFVLNLTKNW